MKRKYGTLVLALVLVFTTLFAASCGKTAKVADYLNPDYDISSDVLSAHSVLFEVDTAVYALVSSNQEFALFTATKTDATVSQILVSMRTGEVIKEFYEENTVYNIDLFDDVPAVLVESTFVDVANPEAAPDTKYELYDALGNVLSTTKYKPDAPTEFTHDTFIFDYATYIVAEDGKVTKGIDIPEYLMIDDCTDYNDKYYYIIDNIAGPEFDGANTVTVYDTSFNHVLTYTLPSYATSGSIFTLNNGDLLVQYRYLVDEDEEDFDITVASLGKLNIETLLISVENGKQKDVKADYVIEEVVTNNQLNRGGEADNKAYTEDFDNIAIISAINEKQIDESNNNTDIVFMSNKGKVGASLKMIDAQLPNPAVKIGDGVYGVTTEYGIAIVDADGKLIKSINTYNLDFVGAYLVGDRAIYNLKLEQVYNLKENEAEVIGSIGDTIFVKEENDDGFTVISFCDGEQNTILTHENEKLTNSVIEIKEDLGYYTIFDPNSKMFEYFNAKGESIFTSSSEVVLTEVCSSYRYGTVILVGTNASYHVFTTAK